MTANGDLDTKIVADVSTGVPLEDGSADLIISRATIEHIQDVEAVIADSYRVLKPGGYAIHYVPLRFALYSLINQLLPHSLAKRIVHFVMPGSNGILGFRA